MLSSASLQERSSLASEPQNLGIGISGRKLRVEGEGGSSPPCFLRVLPSPCSSAWRGSVQLCDHSLLQ